MAKKRHRKRNIKQLSKGIYEALFTSKKNDSSGFIEISARYIK